MKKVIEISLGRFNFTIEDDAYLLLRDYLIRFERTMTNQQEAKEVMEDVESRIAEIFLKEKKYLRQVVDVPLVKLAIEHLGEIHDEYTSYQKNESEDYTTSAKANKKLYRDPDDKKIAGVCSGIAAYLNIDTTLVRVLFLIALICYGSTFLLYIIIWIVTKEAITIPQKLEMRGIPVTAENIRKYSTKK